MKTVLDPIVKSYDRDIAFCKQATSIIEESARIIHCPTSADKSVADLMAHHKAAIRMAMYQRLESLVEERIRYICPRCEAPLAIDYEGSSLENHQLFKLTTCSKNCDFLRKEEIKRDGNKV